MVRSGNSNYVLRIAVFGILSAVFSGTVHAQTPTVNGLFYGDGDDSMYTLLASNGDGRGNLYASQSGDMLYLAVVIDPSVNDNVFGAHPGDDGYLGSAGWTGPYHKARDLVRSDHIELSLMCGDDSWTWKQDFLHDGDGDDDPAESDWLSDSTGPDGDGTPPPGMVSASSMQWNLNNTTWDLTGGGARTGLNDWMSPDDGSGNVGNLAYPMFDASHQWAWSIVYEMSVELAGCAENGFFVEVLSAHNSPSKDGEEDVPISLMDLGDAPEPDYPTLLANDGARHTIVPGYFLGYRIDGEADCAPGAGATGDDNLFTDDEDGITFLTQLVAGLEASIEVSASGGGKLDAWVDFNADKDWDDAGEQIFANEQVTPGTSQLTFSVPADAEFQTTYARFRFSSVGGLSYIGGAPDGEVEDYEVTVSRVPVEISSFNGRVEGTIVELTWTTHSEEENLGFRVYRADGSDHDYQLLTDQMIPGAGTTQSAHSYSYRDESVDSGQIYYYKISDISFDGVEETHGPIRVSVPVAGEELALRLNPPAPNPVREATDIRYSLPAAGATRLVLYDVTGRQRRVVAEGLMEAGVHTARLDRTAYSDRLTAGVYLMRLETQNGTRTQRVILAD